MKTAILLALLLIGLHFQSKADTIDYYHVYFNNTLIRKYNLHNTNQPETIITLHRDSLHVGDVIQIKYWNDTGTGSLGVITMYSESGDLLKEATCENRYYTFSADLLSKQNGKITVNYSRTLEFTDISFSSTLFYIQIE